MAFLKIKISTPVGVFEGMTHYEGDTRENMIKTRDILQGRIDSLETLTLFARADKDHFEDHQITLPGTLLKNSAVEFFIL